MHLFHKLFEKRCKWNWNDEFREVFNKTKQLVTSEQVLCHYDPNLHIRLAYDASLFGLGAVLSHELKDGSERICIKITQKGGTELQPNR